MRFSAIVGIPALTGVASVVSAAPFAPSASSAQELLLSLNKQALQALGQLEKRNAPGMGPRAATQCTMANAGIRRDWEVMTKCERKQYIKAVKCLRSLPSKADPSFAPGARNRYDDFVAVHVNQTLSIHGTGNFLTWHRYITWAYEQALRDECGYKGYQPYWNWFTYVDNPYANPVFDGSDTSMSGDGAFMEHNGTLGANGFVFIPSSKGGGCVKNGPFANITINIGPVRPGMRGLNATKAGNLGYNPRCLSRDLSAYTFKKWMTYENLLNVTVGPAAQGGIGSMQNELQGRFPDGFLSLHGAGHFGIGGDATDLFASINDPTFWLHHTMVDRVYWLWQALHPARAMDVEGTITINNNPPSRNTTKEDLVVMGVNAPTRKIGELLDTLGGAPFCYFYL